MERVVQSGFSGINLFSPLRGGNLRRIHNQIAFPVSHLCQDYHKRNERAISHFCLLGKEPKLMPCHLKSAGAWKQDHGSPLLQCGGRISAEFFVGSIKPSQQADSLSEHIECKDSINGECSVYSSPSLTVGDAEKRGDYMKKLIASIGSVILLSALTVISIRPALAVATIGGTNAAARAGGSAAAAVGRKATSSLLRTELLSSAWTGLVAGVLHTLTGPDHLAALAPLSIGRTKMESAAVGALWGCGHDAGQVIFGILFLLLKDRLHIELLRSWGARVVGMTLLVIGVMGIKEASEIHAPYVALEGGDHQAGILDSSPPMKSDKRKFGFATFATGIVHGLQPDALLMILPALALPSRLSGAAFLCMFLVGTIVAMGSYTAFIGSCSSALKKRVPRITEGLSWGSSLIAIALGVAVLLSEFFGSSLF